MIINVTYDSSVTSASNAAQIEGAIQAAVQFYEHAFTNNITVNIDFKFAPLSGSAAAQNNFNGFLYSYSQVEAALKASAKSADDNTAYSTLPGADPTGGGQFFVPTAAARLLGLSSSMPQFDDTVTLNSNLAWTFDPNNRAVAGQYDAIGALEHEISEGAFGRIQALGMTGQGQEQNWNGWYAPLDLFRYSSSGVRDLTPGSGYFSIDGTHLLQQYNNPVNGGDAADWLPSIQGDSYGDAYTGTVGAVTSTDLRELDILGWNRAETPHDFYGNAFSDVLFENNSTGGVAIWEMNGNGVNIAASSGVGSVGAGWQIAGAGDFNGDYMNDLLWFNSSTGGVALWEMNGSQIISSVGIGSVGTNSQWQIGGLADFYGDNHNDILWFNSNTGDVALWDMNGSQIISSAGVGSIGANSGWQIGGVADFYGDNHNDILWFNSNTGGVALWDMNGSQIISSVGIGSLGANSGWQVGGVGDFYGDHHEDILWFDPSTGGVALWELNGSQIISSVGIGSVGANTGWHIAGVGNYAPGGSGLDILWQNNSTGGLALWEMSGAQITASLSVGSLGANSGGWRIV
jgi:hypothetical protein